MKCPKKIGNVYFHGSRKTKKIALTFDDGPSEETLEILELLKKYNSKATFFVWAKRIKGREAILKKIIEQGNEVGNHSFSHKPFIFRTNSSIRKDIIRADEELNKFNIKTNLFRPPMGLISLLPNAYFVVKQLNKKIIFLDVISNDYLMIKSSKIIKRVLNKTKNGSIISFHDYVQGRGPNKTLVPALRIIIPKLKEKGYELVTVSELLK